MIDDFCATSQREWQSIGSKVVLVVYGAHDERKRRFLANLQLSLASEWSTGRIE